MTSTYISVDATGAVIAANTRAATVTDILTTALSTTNVVTGTYAVIQRLAFAAGGAMVQAKRLRGTFNPFVK